jgi:hypothetical protein
MAARIDPVAGTTNGCRTGGRTSVASSNIHRSRNEYAAAALTTNNKQTSSHDRQRDDDGALI